MTVRHVFLKTIDLFYFPFLRRYIPPQTFRYAVCGGANALFDLGLYYVLYHYVLGEERVIHLPFVAVSSYIAAYLVSFPVSLLTGFWLQKNISFRGSVLRGRTQLFRYVLVVVLNLLINYLGLKLFVGVFDWYPTPSRAGLMGITILVSYLLQRHFTFKGCLPE